MAVQKYVAKNGKTLWYFSVWYVDWTGEKKRKKKEGFRTQREANEAQTKFLDSIKTDIGITFESLVKAYQENHAVRVEGTTFATKDNMIRTKLLPYFGKLPVSEITSATVLKWQTELMKYRNPKTGKPYAPTYLRQMHNQLSAIFNFAIRYYGLKENPARKCGSMGQRKADEFDFWTYDEFQQFILATKEDISAYATFNLLFFSGMRQGEFLALTLNDFDFEKNTVSIKKSSAVINGKTVSKSTKTPQSRRVVKLSQPVMNIVREYANRRYGCNPTDRLFQTSKSALHREMKKYCDISGVRKIKIHELRHSHASHLIELGFSPSLISERLGHSDIKETLNTYSHLYPNKQEEIADLLADYVI